MKQLLVKMLGLVMIAGAISTTSCKKGDAGPQGEKGDSAMANVIYSPWYTTTFQANTTTNPKTVTGGFNVKELTATMLGTAAIHMYINEGTADDPQISSLEQNGLPYYGIVGALVIQLQYPTTTDNTTLGTIASNLSTFPIRYVIIPGGTPAATGRTTNTVNWNNYAEVAAKYGIKD